MTDSRMHGYDDFYDAPVVRLDDWVPQGRGSRTVVRSSIQNGPDLFGYIGLERTDTLFVVFHGAVNRERDRYPRFDRVTSSAKRNRSLLAFADPSLTLADSLGIGWYLGGHDWDPLNAIVDTIRRVREKIGARRIVLLGGSGGGFAAMRAGSRIPDALVFAFSPQSAVFDYNARIVGEYFEAAFPGQSQEEVIAADPRRFSMRDEYAALGNETPHLYYLQNLADKAHVRKHYTPMRERLESARSSQDDTARGFRFAEYQADKPGHGPPSAAEFEQHLKSALAFHEDSSSA